MTDRSETYIIHKSLAFTLVRNRIARCLLTISFRNGGNKNSILFRTPTPPLEDPFADQSPRDHPAPVPDDVSQFAIGGDNDVETSEGEPSDGLSIVTRARTDSNFDSTFEEDVRRTPRPQESEASHNDPCEQEIENFLADGTLLINPWRELDGRSDILM